MATRSLIRHARNLGQTVRKLGPRSAVAWYWHSAAKRIVNRSDKHYHLRTPMALAPLRLRAGASDRHVFHQVFIEHEYWKLPRDAAMEYIVDCGANIGCSSAYFASRYPHAGIIAIEPDSENFEILQANAQPYGGRIRTLNAGIWPVSTDLKVVRGEYRDGAHWATQVREARTDEQADIEAISIPDLMAKHDLPRIDLLKIDIECSELQLFSQGDLSWIDRVGLLVIELHDDACRRAFFKALKQSREIFAFTASGELTFARQFEKLPPQMS